MDAHGLRLAVRPSARRPRGGVAPGHAREAASPGFGMRLSPVLVGGEYGWCVAIEQSPGTIAGGGCGSIPQRTRPIVSRLLEANERTHREALFVLSTPQVADLLVNGRTRVPTYSLAGMPYGLRAARIVRRLAPEVRSRRLSPHSFTPPAEPTLVALNAAGRPIPEGEEGRLEERPVVAGHGPCALHADGLPGLAPQWSHVASAIQPFPGRVVGRAFFSCIDVEYYLRHWPLDAAILLDAAHPGAAPAPIPGLLPVRGDSGYFNGPGDFQGALTATRRGDAWLVVAGGSGLAQRLEVLRHLDPAINLGGG